MVPLAGIEPALLAESDFESDASTSSAIGASWNGLYPAKIQNSSPIGQSLRGNRLRSTLAACGLLLGLAGCMGDPAPKPQDQKLLDDRFTSLWQELVSHKAGPERDKSGFALAAYIEEVKTTYTDKIIKNWVCKPWSMNGKEVPLIAGAKTAHFECLNPDGMRGSVFNLALPAGSLVEPLFNGYSVRFSGKIDKFVFSEETMNSFYVYVTVSAFEIVDRKRM